MVNVRLLVVECVGPACRATRMGRSHFGKENSARIFRITGMCRFLAYRFGSGRRPIRSPRLTRLASPWVKCAFVGGSVDFSNRAIESLNLRSF